MLSSSGRKPCILTFKAKSAVKMIVRFCVNFGAIWRWKDEKMADLVKKMTQNTPFANSCCTKNKFMLHEFLFCAA